MATQMKHFSKFPPELRYMMWQQALIPGPGVHFIKPNSAYNGTFCDPASENAQRVHGPGVSEVSSFSTAVEHARLSMASPEAKEAVENMIRKHGMTRLVLNPSMSRATLNPNAPGNLPIDTSRWGQIIVDKVNDIFIFSTFRSVWFPNYQYSGGIVCEHPACNDIKIMGFGIPGPRDAPRDFRCLDCGKDYTDDQEEMIARFGFCRLCVATWTSELRDIERVYLIVPGIPRAQPGDMVEVFRFGEHPSMLAAFNAMPNAVSSYTQSALTSVAAVGTRPAMTLYSIRSTEPVGPEGPHCFHGSGITLFEVPGDEVPPSAHEFMEFMSDAAYEVRCAFTLDDEEYWPCPRSPKHCGGVVEFSVAGKTGSGKYAIIYI